MSNPWVPVPPARRNNLAIAETQDGVLVYDMASHHLYQLNHVSATIWQLCDGVRSIDAIARIAGVSIDLVHSALVQLSEASLLDATFPVVVTMERSSRRRLLKQVAIAPPLLVSLSAPTAANAFPPA